MRLSGLAILLLAAFAQVPASAQGGSLPPGITAADRAAFERGLLSVDDGLFARLKRDFPRDYEAMIRDLMVQAKASGGDRQAMEQAGFRAMRGFYSAKLSAIVNAPASVLMAYNANELAFVRKLAARDVRLCSTYVMTGFGPSTVVPADLRPDMARIGFGMMAAAKAGAGRPVDPARGQPPTADIEPWFARMREIDSSEEMRRYLSGDQSVAADPLVGCRLGTALYQAVASMPPEQSARITAFLIASSVNRK